MRLQHKKRLESAPTTSQRNSLLHSKKVSAITSSTYSFFWTFYGNTSSNEPFIHNKCVQWNACVWM